MAYRHGIEQFTALSYQLVNLVKEGFLTKYLEVGQEEPKGETTSSEQTLETPILGDLNTIAGGFSVGGSSTSKCKRYAQAVMSVGSRRSGRSTEISLCFINFDLEDVFHHEDNLLVIFIITIGKKVHKVLTDQESSTDVMFCGTFANLQVSLDQLRPYDGCLVSFAGD